MDEDLLRRIFLGGGPQQPAAPKPPGQESIVAAYTALGRLSAFVTAANVATPEVGARLLAECVRVCLEAASHFEEAQDHALHGRLIAEPVPAPPRPIRGGP